MAFLVLLFWCCWFHLVATNAETRKWFWLVSHLIFFPVILSSLLVERLFRDYPGLAGSGLSSWAPHSLFLCFCHSLCMIGCDLFASFVLETDLQSWQRCLDSTVNEMGLSRCCWKMLLDIMQPPWKKPTKHWMLLILAACCSPCHNVSWLTLDPQLVEMFAGKWPTAAALTVLITKLTLDLAL